MKPCPSNKSGRFIIEQSSLCAGCHVFFFASIVTIRRSQGNLIFIDCLPFPSLFIGFLCSSRSLCMQTKHQMRCLLHPQFCFIALPHLGHILVVGLWYKSNRASVGSLRIATLLKRVWDGKLNRDTKWSTALVGRNYQFFISCYRAYIFITRKPAVVSDTKTFEGRRKVDNSTNFHLNRLAPALRNLTPSPPLNS